MQYTSVYASDFETTSQKNLEIDGYVRVYLWSLVSMDLSETYYGFDIESWLEKIVELHPQIVWFHNLRFDGSFILDYMVRMGYEYGKDYKVIIDGMNIWYQVSIFTNGHEVRIWDSLKKFPGLSVQGVAELYKIEGKKEKPHFERYLPEGYIPYTEEIEYCIQDSKIIAYAIQQEFKNGHKSMTLSADAFKSVQASLGGFLKWRSAMPQLSLQEDAESRETYKGGWVYVNPVYQNIELDNIKVYDVNSLYPWAMKFCELPWGSPMECYGKPDKNYLYIYKFKSNFELKEDHLPTVQIKGNPLYKETEYLTESFDNVTLSMTNIDYELFKEHYYIYDEEPIKYVAFKKKKGLLSEYIDYWTNIKIQATKDEDWAMRFIAKRYLNSPYGKTGMRPDRLNKIPYLDDNGDVRFSVNMEEVDGIYVPYASFVCAQARNKTIRSAQKHYKDFIYADTDSLHLLGNNHDGLEIDNYKLGAWKLEGEFEKGKYIRPKTYIHADSNYKIEEIKCAGMPDNIKAKCSWDKFQDGQEFDGKLMQKRVPGGVVLVSTTYKIKEMME